MSYQKDAGKDYLTFDNQQIPLPNSTAVLVLGILSLVLCVFYGIMGVILGTIGLVLANKDLTLHRNMPERYTVASYNNLKAGRICSIIGLSLGALFLVFAIIFVFFVVNNAFPFRR
jgi:hypothetical protein